MESRERYKEIFQKVLDEYREEYKKLNSIPDTKDSIQDTEKVFDLWELEEAIGIIKELVDNTDELGSPKSVIEDFDKKAEEYYEAAEYEGEYPSFHWNGDHYYYFAYMGKCRAYKRLSSEISKLAD